MFYVVKETMKADGDSSVEEVSTHNERIAAEQEASRLNMAWCTANEGRYWLKKGATGIGKPWEPHETTDLVTYSVQSDDD